MAASIGYFSLQQAISHCNIIGSMFSTKMVLVWLASWFAFLLLGWCGSDEQEQDNGMEETRAEDEERVKKKRESDLGFGFHAVEDDGTFTIEYSCGAGLLPTMISLC